MFHLHTDEEIRRFSGQKLGLKFVEYNSLRREVIVVHYQRSTQSSPLVFKSMSLEGEYVLDDDI